MGDRNPDLVTNRYIKKVLYVAGFVILALMICAAWSFSYAKYISSQKSNNNSNVAGVGVEHFELVKPEDDNYDWEVIKYIYRDTEIGASYKGIVKYDQVLPGVDLPAPYINLKIYSEVSYRLYVRIKVSKQLPWYNYIDEHGNVAYASAINANLVDYKTELYDTWEPVTSESVDGEKYTVYTYKSKEVYKAGQRYNDKTDPGKPMKVSILSDDLIYVSQYYGLKDELNPGYNTPSFTIEFEAFIRQVLE